MKKLMLLTILIFFLLAGLAAAARLNIFVNIEHPLATDARFEVIRLSLINDQGVDVPVTVSNPDVSTAVSFRQAFLAGPEVPEGIYTGVVLKIRKVRLGTREIPGQREVKVDAGWELKEGESRCLFLVWDVRGSLRENGFAPSFYAMFQARPLRGETLYVTCDTINTLFAIRTDTNRVVASLATKDTPRQVAAFPRGDRLYVLCERSRSLLSVEMSTFRVIDSLLVPMVQSPRFLALVNGHTLAVTDPTGSQIFLVDADTGSLLRSRRLGQQLANVFYWKRGRQLFVASSGEQKVYQLNADLSLARSYETGSSPRGIWVQNGWLYVADSGSGTVSLFNLETGKLLGRVRSGRKPVRILGTRRRVFISNWKDGTLSVLWPGQMAISRRIKVGLSPSALAVCNTRRWLYVADSGGKGVAVVNSISMKKMGMIALGCGPWDVAVAR